MHFFLAEYNTLMFSGIFFLLFGRNVNHLYFVLPFIQMFSDSHSHVTVQKA